MSYSHNLSGLLSLALHVTPYIIFLQFFLSYVLRIYNAVNITYSYCLDYADKDVSNKTTKVALTFTKQKKMGKFTVIIIMVIFKCHFSGELITLSLKKYIKTTMV